MREGKEGYPGYICVNLYHLVVNFYPTIFYLLLSFTKIM